MTFGVSKTAILDWERLYKENGCLTKRKLNRKHKKIDPEELSAYIVVSVENRNNASPTII